MRFLTSLAISMAVIAQGYGQPRTMPKSQASDPGADEEKLPSGVRLQLGSTLFRVVSSNRYTSLMPDGRTIVQFVPPERLNFIAIANGKVEKSIKLKEPIQAGYGLAFSPNGKWLVVSAYNTATIINPATGAIAGKLTQRTNNAGFAKRLQSLNDGHVTISDNGKRIAFGTRYPQGQKESFAYVFDFDKNDFVAEMPVDQSQYIQAVLSADGKTLATFGQYYVRNNEENTAPIAQLWDLETKKEITKLKTGSSQVTAAKFSPDGKLVFTGGQNGPMEAWDTKTGQRVRQYVTRSNVGQKIFVSDDGRRLAAASGDSTGAVQVWEVHTGKRLGVGFAPVNSVDTVALPPDGPAVAFGMYYQTLQVWTVPGEILTPQDGHYGAVNQIQYTLDGRQILTCGQDGRVVRWDVATGDEIESYGYASSGSSRGRAMPARSSRWPNSWNVYNSVFSPDARTLYLTGQGGIPVVDLATGIEQHTLFFPSSRNGSSQSRPSLSADGRRIGSAGQYYDRNKYIFTAAAWDVETGEVLAQMRKETDSNISYINGMATAVSTDGQYFGIMCNIQDQRNGQSFLEFTTFDLKNGRELSSGSLGGRAYSPYLQAVPDNRSAIALDQQHNNLMIWDLPTGKQTRTFPGYNNGAALPPTFHPSGRTFAIAMIDPSGDGNRYVVQLVEWSSGEIRTELTSSGRAITALEFAPNGNEIAIGRQDSTVLIVDATDNGAPKPWITQPTDPARLWEKMTGKSGRDAWAAIRELTHRPDVALKLIREHIKPVDPPSQPKDDEVAKLITNLNAPAFAVREAAMKDLKRYGKTVENQLSRAVDTTPSPETKERIEKLLALLIKPAIPNPPEARAVEVLERIGSPEAKAELAKLAAGDPASLMTQDANRSLKRLGGK